MIGQCFLSGQQLPVLSHGQSQVGAKAGNACFEISLPATNRCASRFTAHLEARKCKTIKSVPTKSA